MRRAAMILSVLLGLVIPVACSSGSTTTPDRSADGTAGTTTTVAPPTSQPGPPAGPPSTGNIDRTPVPPGAGIVDTTEMTRCDTRPGAVAAEGTVQLPAGMTPRPVMVSVSWVNAATATVFSRSRVRVDGSTEEPTPWLVENLLPDNGVAVRCTLGAVALD